MSEQAPVTLGQIVSRLYWMMIGPFVLVLLAFLIVKTGDGWLTRYDVAYLGMLAGLILARWLEFRSGNPRTAEGTPATPKDLRKYAIGAVAFGMLAWVIANILGNYLLTNVVA